MKGLKKSCAQIWHSQFSHCLGKSFKIGIKILMACIIGLYNIVIIIIFLNVWFYYKTSYIFSFFKNIFCYKKERKKHANEKS